VPRHSDVVPTAVDVSTQLTATSAERAAAQPAMDTVTESRLAIAMAQQGGSASSTEPVDRRAGLRSDRVKRSESGMIVDPITLSPTHRIFEALDLMKNTASPACRSPKTAARRALVGILTTATCASRPTSAGRLPR